MKLWSILALLLLLVVWAAVIVLGLPLWLAVVPTVLVVVLFAGLFLWQRLQARKSAREIESALHAQADAHARTLRPDLQPEVQAMQAEFEKAVSALKTSKLARGGSDALSVLPWYLIIGPPGSGKSTALRNSGLQFPYLSARGGGVRGVGGTRNCEWWLTNEAVILDTAGRYTTEDDDREEWTSFLDTLGRTRPRKPINGLIVGVAISELGGLDEEAAGQLGARLRERVDEVMSRLKMILPVYVLFTKMDLLAGFTELFGEMPKNERGQTWGYTLSVGAQGASAGERFTERFSELANALEKRVLRRLGRERRQEARERIYRFPQQFEALEGNLREFIQTLFAENVYQDTPVMRGVYFTSGTQEGRPLDRIMQSMAGAFGLPPALAGDEPAPLDAKSYFLKDVFSTVIFPDRELAVRSTSETRRLVNVRYAAAAGALVFALALLVFPSTAFVKNRELALRTRSLSEAVRQGTESGDTAEALERLAPLAEHMELLLGHQQQGVPFSMTAGMYAGDALFEPVRAFYAAAVRKLLVQPLLAQDVQDMDVFAERAESSGAPPSEREHVLFFDRLKLHLLLTGPRAEGEPILGEAEQRWLTDYLKERWRRRPGIAGKAEALRALETHLQVFVRLVGSDATLLGARNEAAVKRTRAALSRLPITHLALEQFIAEPALEDHDVTLPGILGASISQLASSGRVRGAFTRSGYDAVVSSKLEAALAGRDLWVLGPARGSRQETDVLGAELRSYYFERYIQEWRTFLDSIQVLPPANNAEALGMLEDLTRGPPSPLARLFSKLADNVRVPRDGAFAEAAEDTGGAVLAKLRKKLGSNADKAEGAVVNAVAGGSDARGLMGPRDVEESFAGLLRFGAPAPKRGGKEGAEPAQTLPLDVYQEQLVFLRDALRSDVENPEDHAPMMTRLQTARVAVRSLIESQEIGWRPRLEALLWPPIEGVSHASTTAVASGASMQWCSTVVSVFDRSLARRYPFNRDGHDAALADIADFYKPKSGTLWSFYESTLQSDMLRQGSNFQFARRLGSMASSIYRPSVLAFLTNANQISNALFAPGQEMGVQFSVHVRPTPRVAAVSLTVDGQVVDYRNGPEEWHALKWPNAGRTQGALLKVRTAQGATESLVQEGEWGLFRLLEAARVEASPDGRTFTATWSLKSLGVDVSVDFRSARTETPFFGDARRGTRPQLLAPFRRPVVAPPRSIGKGSPECAG